MRVLITAGATRERIDAVRFISNRSSGRLGVEIARAAALAGEHVTLAAAAGVAVRHEMNMPNVRVERFESHADLQALLSNTWPDHEVLIMAAAVSDWKPLAEAVTDAKHAPGMDQDRWQLELEPTEDLVAHAARSKRPDQRIIAFALQAPETLEREALRKLRDKQVDAIVANPLTTMDADGIDASVYWADGRHDTPGAMTKPDFAHWLVRDVLQRLHASP